MDSNRISALAEYAHKAGGYEILLPGLKFPVDKEGLLVYAERERGDILPVIRALQTSYNNTYYDVSILEDDVSNVFNRLPEIVEYKRKHGISEMIRLRININKETTSNPGRDDLLEGKFPIFLPRIEYPLNKEALIQNVKEFQNKFNKKYKKVPSGLEQTLFLMEKLPNPNRIYKDASPLMFDLDVLVGDRGIAEKLVGIPMRLRGCSLYQPNTPNDIDPFMKQMIDYDVSIRLTYIENKRDYQEQKKEVTK